MGNFAENLNLGNRFRPPLAKCCLFHTPPPTERSFDFLPAHPGNQQSCFQETL